MSVCAKCTYHDRGGDKMKKRLIALFTALSMSVAALSGCADDAEEEENSTEESGEKEEKDSGTSEKTEVKRSIGNRSTDTAVATVIRRWEVTAPGLYLYICAVPIWNQAAVWPAVTSKRCWQPIPVIRCIM